MAGLQLQPLPPSGAQIADEKGRMDPVFRIALQSILDQLQGSFNDLADVVAAIQAVEADVTTVQADIVTVQSDVVAVAAAVAAIEVPPTGSRTVTTTEVLTANDYALLADASGGAITLVLPAASAALNSIIVIKTDASVNAVNIEPGGSDNLNGVAAPTSITTQGAQRIFNSDGTADWYG